MVPASGGRCSASSPCTRRCQEQAITRGRRCRVRPPGEGREQQAAGATAARAGARLVAQEAPDQPSATLARIVVVVTLIVLACAWGQIVPSTFRSAGNPAP